MSTPPALLPLLRQHTRDVHDALEQTRYARALQSKELPLGWLQRFLQGEEALLGATLAAQRGSPLEALRALDCGLASRHARTLADLEGLAPHALPAPLEQLLGQQRALLKDQALRAPWSVLGMIYVIAGSALGGVQIAHWLRQALPAQRAWMTRFEDPQQVARRWRALCTRMEALAIDPAAAEQAVQGARLGFGAYLRWMEALVDPAQEQA